MLHNTGPYGPNETPVNMATSVNVTPSAHMNIVSNINHLSKLGHQNAPTPSGTYGLGDYGVYNHPHFSMTSPIPQFPNYQHLGFQHNYTNNNPGSPSDGNFQNGMFPMNLNVNNEHNANLLNYSYEKRLLESPRPDIIKEQNIRKIPLNIPQIPNKSLAKHHVYNDDYVHNDSFHNPNHDLDLSMKSHDRLPLNNVRRKKIENTVKLIEDILINSGNISKEVFTETIYDNEPQYHSKRDVETNITTVPTTNVLRKATNTSKSSKQDVPEVDPLSLTVEDTSKVIVQERESIIKSPIRISYEKPDTEDQISDSEDVKPVGLPDNVSEAPVTLTSEKNVEIKIENASWTDTDYAQPFFRDSNAFQREDALDYRIIDSDSSVHEALSAIKNVTDEKTTTSNNCYECPHCCILLKDPKRFLIHTKWHTFGLTVEKRTELMREREEQRNQRKEAKIIERMNAKEITDQKVVGKTWPCKDCDKVFSAKGSLKNHRQRTHPTRVRECKICHKSLVGWIALRNHLSTHAGEAGVGFQCSECPKRFKYAHSLAKHSDTHLEKVHACEECPKKFGSQALLKMHMKSHERQSRGATFRCTYCAKGFFESYSLTVHERTHRNERPYQCEICNTSFGTNSSLKRHLKVSHSTSKPWECSVCHRSFSTESIRDRHELRLHGKPEDFKFPCKECDCKYLKLKDLQKHVYKAHPKGKRKKAVASDAEQTEDTE
ncbi:uncharacterized protein LOC142984764 [Anticarsia gemmatalis]|uniref:uncharacterized protein LOC142984764 n=1 Tax=Anticarsia gemmatalis TaxID=129554 RepID=UPI003F76B6F0